MTFQLPNSQLDLTTVNQAVPELLVEFAQAQQGFNGLQLTAQVVQGPIFEPQYGLAKWTMQLQNNSQIYRGTVTLTGALDASQKIKYFLLGGVRHEETQHLFPDLAAVRAILKVAIPCLQAAPTV